MGSNRLKLGHVKLLFILSKASFSNIPLFQYSMGAAIRVGVIKNTATFASLQRLRNLNEEM
jgi:hypothetical protein